MAYAYPIWNIVTNCNYKSDKSYGNKDTAECKILVGSSSSNSHNLIEHFTTRRFRDEYKGYKNVCVFKFGVEFEDGHKIVITEKIFKDNNGRAGELIKTNNLSKRVKGL